MTFSN
jgi:hypothetical protein